MPAAASKAAVVLVALAAGAVAGGASAPAGAQQAPLQLLPPDMRVGPAPPQNPGPWGAAPTLNPTQPPQAPPPLAPPREVAPPPGGLTESERSIPSALAPGGASGGEAPGTAEPWDAAGTEGAVAMPRAPGILTPQTGGFADDLWSGTPGARVADLLAALPIATTSPVVADLRRRLLLSQQSAPDGLSVLALLRVRLGVLVRAGASADEVMTLAAPVGRDATIDRLRLQSLLVDADDARACTLVRAVGMRYPAPMWQQAAIHCESLDGNREAAALGLSMLREIGAGQDAGGRAFTLLAERLAGLSSPSPESFAGASPVAWRLLRRLPDVDAPADALDPEAPWTARALALADAGKPEELHAEAAERAAAAGALSIEDLGAHWVGLVTDRRDLTTPLSQVVQGGTARDRALAFTILLREINPDHLAEGLIHPLETSRARTPALYPTHARLYAPLIREIPVGPRTPAFLGEAAVRALYVSGSIEAGRAWLTRLEAQGRDGDLQAEDAVALVWPLARMADPALGDAVPTERLLYWRQAWAARLGETAEGRRTLDRAHVMLLTLFETLGANIGEAHWLPLRSNRVFVEAVTVEGGYTDSTHLAALDQAASDGRIGETVALALLALGPDGPAGASLDTMRGVLTALRAINLNGEARRLAVEALAAWGGRLDRE